jgi:hypothetical protein
VGSKKTMEDEEVTDFITLSKMVVEINKVTTKTLKSCIPLLTAMQDDSCDIFEDVANRLEIEDVVSVIDDCREEALRLANDTKKVKTEISSFLKKSKGCYQLNEDPDSYLFNVWSGDVYDVTGIESFQLLLDELKKTQQIFLDQTMLTEHLVEKIKNK